MAKKKASVPGHLQLWIEARRKFRLSHAHLQMAFELGVNPKKLGKLDDHHQEPWKLPLPDFIAKLYRKRCGKDRPDTVRSIEEMAAAKRAKALAKKSSKAMRGRTLESGPPLRAGEGTCHTTAATNDGTRENSSRSKEFGSYWGVSRRGSAPGILTEYIELHRPSTTHGKDSASVSYAASTSGGNIWLALRGVLAESIVRVGSEERCTWVLPV
jgi:hypothetical protein